jgi:hypothetical protein
MDDLSYLIKKYYLNSDDFSQSTSSHWRKYGAFQKVKISNSHTSEKLEQTNLSVGGGLELSGEGFGDFKRNSFRNSIISLFVFVYLAIKWWPQLSWKSFLLTFRFSLKTKQIFGYDLTRMILSINFLANNIGNLDGKKVVIIGDGYGRFGGLLKTIYPNCQVVYINLGRTLLFDYFYSMKSHPQSQHKLITKENEFIRDFNYIEAETYQDITLKGDIFINIASMQEMDMKQINEYFDLICSQIQGTIFYCCNRVSKRLPDDSVIDFFKYNWGELKLLIDELCPWHQKFPSIRPPFIRNFDGPVQHRLVKVV